MTPIIIVKPDAPLIVKRTSGECVLQDGVEVVFALPGELTSETLARVGDRLEYKNSPLYTLQRIGTFKERK